MVIYVAIEIYLNVTSQALMTEPFLGS